MKKSKKPLLIFFATSLVSGALDPILPHGKHELPPLTLIYVIIGVLCLYSWCKLDAAERGVSGKSAVFVALFALLGIPYYFLRTRPFLQALLGIFKALGVFILLNLTYGIAAVIVTLIKTHYG